MESHPFSSKRPVLSGIVAGQLAGLIMAVVVMLVFTLFLGHGPLYPVQVIGSTVFGEPALQGIHIGAILVGLLLHQLGPSLLWGFLYGVSVSKLSVQNPRSALKLGVALGIISMIGPYVLIPIIMTTLHGADFWNREVPLFWDWAAHIVFGVSVGLIYPGVARKLSRSG